MVNNFFMSIFRKIFGWKRIFLVSPRNIKVAFLLNG